MDAQAAAPDPEAFAASFYETADYGSLIYRIGAQLLDLGVHYGVAAYAGICLGFGAFIVAPERAEAFVGSLGANSFLGVSFSILGWILYHACMEGVHGSSLGKGILGLTVLSEDGRPCTLKQGWKRSLAFLVDSLFFGLIGFNAIRKSKRRQRVGDEWADTVVVRTRSLPAFLRRPRKELFAAFATGCACDFLALGLGQILSFAAG